MAEKCLARLSDADLVALHVTIRYTFWFMLQIYYARWEASRLQLENCFQENYSNGLNAFSPIIRYKLTEACSGLFRSGHAGRYPRFYIICVDIDRITTSEISILIETYTNIFTYVLHRKSVEFVQEPPFYKNLLLCYQTLEKFYHKNVRYMLVFEALLILQTASPFWDGYQAAITNQYEKHLQDIKKKLP